MAPRPPKVDALFASAEQAVAWDRDVASIVNEITDPFDFVVYPGKLLGRQQTAVLSTCERRVWLLRKDKTRIGVAICFIAGWIGEAQCYWNYLVDGSIQWGLVDRCTCEATPNEITTHTLDCGLTIGWGQDPRNPKYHKCVRCGKQATEWTLDGYGCSTCLESY